MNIKNLTFAGTILLLAIQACLVEGRGRSMKGIVEKLKKENALPVRVESEKRFLHSTDEIKRILAEGDNNNNKPKVIIIGAGSAGIGAAEKLVELGITDFKIIEATDEIGGRLHVEKLPTEITDQYPSLAGVYYEVGGIYIYTHYILSYFNL